MDRNWKVKQLSYNDFPLLIRYPKDQRAFSNKVEFPTLAIITHHLSKVSDNGLPDPDYNNTLFDFDKSIRDSFESKDIGITMLVETFTGRRNYYIYTVTKANIASILAKTIDQYSQHKITWVTRSDPTWKFIDEYTDHFLK